MVERHITDMVLRDHEIRVQQWETKELLRGRYWYYGNDDQKRYYHDYYERKRTNDNSNDNTASKNCDELLKKFGLKPGVTFDEVRTKRYRYLQQYHPDKCKSGDKEQCAEQFEYYVQIYNDLKQKCFVFSPDITHT